MLFSGCSILAVYFTCLPNGKPSGGAYVELASAADHKMALQHSTKLDNIKGLLASCVSVGQGGHVPPICIKGDVHGNVPPNILEVMPFRMSTRVTTRNCVQIPKESG